MKFETINVPFWNIDGAFAEIIKKLSAKPQQLNIKWMLNCKTLRDRFSKQIIHSLLVFIVRKKLSMLHIGGMYRKLS